MSFLNLLNVCRVCLVENSAMKSVFGVENVMEQPLALCDVLMSCASVQVFKGDGLPENICLKCTQEMNRAFTFRKLCEKSDAVLKQCLNTIKPAPVENGNVHYQFKSEEVPVIQGDPPDVINKRENEINTKTELKTDVCEVKQHVYDCKMCTEKCVGLREYKKHTTKHLQCDKCNKIFKSKTVFNRHKNSCEGMSTLRTHKNKTGIVKKRNLPRTCTICNKTFRFHSNLERHKLIHTGEKPYLCNVCGKGFAQLSYLKIHSFIHTGEKPYKCQMCEKCFAAPGTLMTHIRTHTGERPHVCKICGKDFPQSGYLSTHIRTHTGEKPVECKVCQRRFNQSGRLIIHMRIHSGEKPYTCTECGRSFAVKGTLKKHIRTHTGERPYKCTMCGQAFAQSGTLATHMKVHRPK